MRKAFNATMADKEFIADMEKQQLPLNPLTGEEAETIIARMMNVPPAIVARARSLYE